MKQNYYIFSILITVIIVVIIIFFPKEALEYKKMSGFIQGTTYNITCECKKSKDLQPEIEKVLKNFDMSLSTYEPKSIISRINQNDPSAEVDELFIRVFNKSLEVYHNSNGAFDITIAPIVNAWGFGFTPGTEIDSNLIDSLLQFVGMDKVHLAGKKISKENPSVMLDVNAIAQGYSVDVVCKFLDKQKVVNYLVEIGGELRAKGINPKGEDWKIGVDKPIEGNMFAGKELEAIIAIKNKAMATSGNYRKFYEKNGVKYAHTIDPRSGYPVLNRLLSTTILAPDCITADAYATAFMVMGLEKSIAYLSNQEEIDAYLIYSDIDGNYQTYSTPGMKSHIIEEMN